MSLKTLFAGHSDRKAEMDQLKTALFLQKDRLSTEMKVAEEKMAVLREQAAKFNLEKTTLESRLKAIEEQNVHLKSSNTKFLQENSELHVNDAFLKQENLDTKSQLEQLSYQVKNYQALADTNWALYEKAKEEAKNSREVMEKITQRMNEIHALIQSSYQNSRTNGKETARPAVSSAKA